MCQTNVDGKTSMHDEKHIGARHFTGRQASVLQLGLEDFSKREAPQTLIVVEAVTSGCLEHSKQEIEHNSYKSNLLAEASAEATILLHASTTH